jgi:hypothetical protein
VTARRWWLILAALASVEAGCLYGTYWLTTLDPQAT